MVFVQLKIRQYTIGYSIVHKRQRVQERYSSNRGAGWMGTFAVLGAPRIFLAQNKVSMMMNFKLSINSRTVYIGSYSCTLV